MTNKEIIYPDREFGSFPKDVIIKLNKDSKEKYWKEALNDANYIPNIRKGWFRNNRKGYFYSMMSNSEKGRVLDLGAGSGIISDALSKCFRKVISLELKPYLVDFMRNRFEQDKRDNIKIIRSNALLLPFKDESFDLMVVNGLLEWLPNFTPNVDPKETQMKFLGSLLQKLNMGGEIIIAIENRFYFNHFLGHTPHGDYPFTTILPRSLSNLITNKITSEPYQNYIYSSFGYKRMLKKAGFKNVRIFIIIPNYYDPRIILPLKNNSIINKFVRSSGELPKIRIKKILFLLLLKLGILKHFMHSFYIIGEKR